METIDDEEELPDDPIDRVAMFISDMAIAAINSDGAWLELVYGASSERRTRTPDEQVAITCKVVEKLTSRQADLQP